MVILLETKNLSIEYKSINNDNKTSVLAVDDVSIKINEDRVGIMYFGKLIEENYTSTLFKYPQEEYTKRMLNSVPILKGM